MNQTLIRRAGMMFGLWHLLRFQSRLCRWSKAAGVATGEDDAPENAPGARWLGKIRIGKRSEHALFCPPSVPAVYRLAAPIRSRVVTWCGLLPGMPAHAGEAEFVISVRIDGSSDGPVARLRLDSRQSAGRRTWHKLVLELQNGTPQQIELTLTIHLASGASAEPCAVWGEPFLEWPRPTSELKDVLGLAGREALRGKMLTALRTLHGQLSATTNPTVYQMWLQQHAVPHQELTRMAGSSGSLKYRPLISVVTPVYNTDPRWLRACIESVKRQAYPHWQLCLADDGSSRADTLALLREYGNDPRIRMVMMPENGGIAAASNHALALAEGEFVAFLDHDDEITPDALFRVAAHLNQHPDADLLYSDEDKLELDGRRDGVYFKPAWSHEHFLTNMYTCHLMVVRRSLVERIGGFRTGYEGAQDYDFVLRLIEHTTRIDHLPQVLYHWRRIPESTAGSANAKPWANDAGRLALQDYVRRNNMDAQVLPGAHTYLYRVRFAIRDQPLVSIILPPLPDAEAADRIRRCEQTVRTLVERTSYRRFEVLLPASGERPAEGVQRLLDGLPWRTIEVAASSGRVRALREAAAHATGDYLLFMDWGLSALDDEWLTALLEYCQQDAIGAVGAKLHYPDGSLKHIGIVLGVNGVAAPAFHRHPRSSLGYWSTAVAARNYSAVTGDCMITRRSVYHEVGGFDDEMGVFADVDFCLRLTAAGYRVVFTPHAPLVHLECEERRPRDRAHDANNLQARWRDRLARDPYYNANLSRDSPDYEPDLSIHSDAGV